MKRGTFNLVVGGILAMAALPWFIGKANAGPGLADSTNLANAPIKVSTYYANSPAGLRQDPLDITGTIKIDTGTALRKFVDGLPGIPGFTTYDNPTSYPAYYKTNLLPNSGVTNNLGQKIPLAIPDTTTYPGCNYYVIGVVEYKTKMHSDLLVTNPAGTTIRGYVQLETPNNASVSKHIALTYPNGTNILDPKGNQLYAVDYPNYLGPVISTTTGTHVRITYANLLPIGHFSGGQRFGDLFLPVDHTLMGAGVIPGGTAGELYTENRVSIHFHGGDTPWISDGTPNQYTVPYGETTSSKIGDSFALVPDMPDPGAGWGTNYYQNDISGRFMFYHDHAVAITRLNVYAGMVAGYLINDAPGVGEKFPALAAVLPTDQIPLIIQDKTFVPKDVNYVSTTNNTTKVGQDEKWDTTHWGKPGDLWYPHVYEFNQDPNSFDGTNPPGRWDYGPYFWPIFPASGTLPTGEYGNASTTPEAYDDTPVVNGTAYPVLNVDPKAYRFRILNGSNDRFFNLGLYVAADKTTPTTPGTTGTVLCDGTTAVATTNCTEVKMVSFDATGTFPAYWGQPDSRVGGVPDPATAGPDMIEIGNEGALLAQANVIPSTPINYEYNKKSVTVLNVLQHGLWMGPAERTDVVVDFSAFKGKTLILYNDSSAAVPAGDPRLDYYTGDPDFSSQGGAPTTLSGYGPNIRTIMQINVSNATPAPLNATALEAALPAAFASNQPKPVIAEPPYDTAFGTNYAGGIYQLAHIFTGSINSPAYTFTTGDAITYYPFVPGTTTLSTTKVTIPAGGTASIPVKNPTIQELFDPYGRMNATLGVELPYTGSNTQTTVPLGYVDPVTESIEDGETQIWKITHNGVDTHPVHFHLVNVQVLNRVGWDGTIKAPYADELGWKETVKMNPLEDIIVAVRANAPKVPFGVPDSVRPLSPSEPLHSTVGFSNLDPLTGNPLATPTTNEVTNFGWEYVWHCHILGHEENDFMRTISFRFVSLVPPTPTNLAMSSASSNQVVLSWTDPTPITTPATYGNHANEIGFTIQRAPSGGSYTTIGNAIANSTTYTDTTVASGSTYRYRISAYNAAGSSAYSNSITTPALTAPTVSLTAPANGATYNSGATVALAATASATTGRTISKVEFYANGILIGTDTTAPYTFNWTASIGGTVSLTAKAWDNVNVTTTSTARSITVTLQPPTVSLTAPANGASYNTGASIPMAASASAFGTLTIAKVEFYVNGALVGTATTAPYTYNWTNTATPGTYSLTAKAYDSVGITSTSAVVSITIVPNSPPTVSLTPTALTSSPGSPQTFTAVYSDAYGFSNLNTAYFLVTGGGGGVNDLYFRYDRPTNTLNLFSDSTGFVTSCTPGQAITLSNSQGSVDCSGSSVTGSGNNLTLTLKITPTVAFASPTPKNIYMYVNDNFGLAVGWVLKGSWTIYNSVAPTIGTLTPSLSTSSPGLPQTFTQVYSSANGFSNLNTAYFLVTGGGGGVNDLYFRYDRPTNTLNLFSDSTGFVTSCTPGQAITLSNSQGSVDCSGSSVTGAGTDLTLQLKITPTVAFASPIPKQMYMYAIDNAGFGVGWALKGSWTIYNSVAPTIGTLTPSSLASSPGLPQTFTQVYSSANGFSNLNTAYFLVTGGGGGVNDLYFRYDRPTNTLNLFSDSTGFVTSCTPGQAITLSNSQGSVDCSGSSVTGAGTDLTLQLKITPTVAFASAAPKLIYIYARDNLGLGVGWVLKGSWVIQ